MPKIKNLPISALKSLLSLGSAIWQCMLFAKDRTLGCCGTVDDWVSWYWPNNLDFSACTTVTTPVPCDDGVVVAVTVADLALNKSPGNGGGGGMALESRCRLCGEGGGGSSSLLIICVGVGLFDVDDETDTSVGVVVVVVVLLTVAATLVVVMSVLAGMLVRRKRASNARSSSLFIDCCGTSSLGADWRFSKCSAAALRIASFRSSLFIFRVLSMPVVWWSVLRKKKKLAFWDFRI